MTSATSNQGFVDHWARVGPKLAEIERQELRDFVYEDNYELVDSLLQLGYLFRQPSNTCGLVELQKIFQAARKNERPS